MSLNHRILLALAAVLALNTVLLVAVTGEQMGRTFTAQGREFVGDALNAADRRFRRTGQEIGAAVAAVGRDRAWIGLLEAAAKGEVRRDSHGVVAAADDRRGAELDVLRAYDSAGVVLSSSPDRERFGAREPEAIALASLPASELELLTLEVNGVPEHALVQVSRPAGDVVLLGGRLVDDRFVAALGEFPGVVAAARIDGDWIGAAAAGIPPSGLDGDPSGAVSYRDGRLLATRRLLGDRMRLTVVADVSTMAALRGRLARAAVAVGVLSLVLSAALALLLSRSLSRPLNELVRAIERVGAGRWEEPVRVRTRARELVKLEEAFNGMIAALGRERAALQRAERAAAWREAAQRVAHEIKNALTPLQIAWERLQAAAADATTGDREAREARSRTMAREIATLRRIVGEFSELARWPEPRFQPVDVSELARAAAALYADGGRSIRVRASESAPARADPGQITRAIANLIQNALDATSVRGEVQISTYVNAGRSVLEVSDDGPGMDEKTRAKIFTPYFTTREGGTGLGLSIVERVADAHGAEIEVHTAPGEGATFRLRFPPVDAGAG
jgi:signal transduction histidine kinase